jgi:hypothetical protein
MRFSFFKITLYLSLIILLCSCGDTSSGIGYVPKEGERDVVYSIDCENGPSCNTPHVGRWWSGNTQEMNCEWYCGNSKNYRRQLVIVYFSKKPNECWKFDSESVVQGHLCS